MTEPEGFPSYQPDPRLPATQPPRPPSTGHRLGRADGVQTRVESHGSERSSETVLSFRLLDPASPNPVEVELRGYTLSGSVRDGDWVEVPDRVARSGRLEATAVSNLTTGSQVSTRGSSRSAGARVFKVIFVIVFIAILAAIIIGAVTMVMTPM